MTGWNPFIGLHQTVWQDSNFPNSRLSDSQVCSWIITGYRRGVLSDRGSEWDRVWLVSVVMDSGQKVLASGGNSVLSQKIQPESFAKEIHSQTASNNLKYVIHALVWVTETLQSTHVRPIKKWLIHVNFYKFWLRTLLNMLVNILNNFPFKSQMRWRHHSLAWTLNM